MAVVPVPEEGKRDTLVRLDNQEAVPAPPKKRGILAADRIKEVISRRDIHWAYVAVVLASVSFSFGDFSTSIFTAYATSAFRAHSDLATAGVLVRVLSACTNIIMPKVTDNVGRMSPTLFFIFLIFCVIRDALLAGCKNISMYIGANVFTIGDSGWNILMQIYIAETTSVVSRGLWNVLPEGIGSIAAMYSGSEVGGVILDKWGTDSGWRWGYGMFSIINFVTALPFIGMLYSWHLRARREGTVITVPPPTRNPLRMAFHEFDIVGLLLSGAGVSLVLVPITLAKGLAAKWTADNIAMICIGFGLIICFVIWSLPRGRYTKFLPQPEIPFLPWSVLRNFSALALCFMQMFDFMSYACFTTYFQSYLQVAVGVSPTKASRIDNTLRIVFQSVSIIMGLLMRFWKPICRKLGLGERTFHTKYPIMIAVPLCTIGIALDINFVQYPRRSTAIASFVIAKAIYGVARALLQICGLVSVQVQVKRGELGVATGIFFTMMSVGGAIGLAISGAIWNNTLPQALLDRLPAETAAMARRIFGSIVVAQSYELDSPTGLAITDAYCHTMKRLAIVATCMTIPMLIAMPFVKDVLLDDNNDQEVKPGRGRPPSVDPEETQKDAKSGEYPEKDICERDRSPTPVFASENQAVKGEHRSQ